MEAISSSKEVTVCREAVRSSGVVKRVEDDEVVMDLNQWSSESSRRGEEEEEEEKEEGERLNCEFSDPEKWD